MKHGANQISSGVGLSLWPAQEQNRTIRPAANANTRTSDGTSLDSNWIVAKAKELGFDLCGVVATEQLADPERLNEWLERGFAGEMRYLRDPRRADPALVLPGARSVIVCAVNYNREQPYSTEAAAQAAANPQARGWISRYAWGDDYHVVLGEMLDGLLAVLRERHGGDFTARAYVDTGPIAERSAAKLAGLGWLGKNTCLINKEIGSWLFLGVIVTSLVPGVDTEGSGADFAPAPDLCGNCRLCLDACPTGALVEPYVLDARRCISYLTIELRGSIPEELRGGMGWQVFGCDICQDVCPWNRAAPVSAQKLPARGARAAFAPRERLAAPELVWLLSLTEAEFREVFRGSPVKRTKWRGLVRNACVAAGNALAKAHSGRNAGEVAGESAQEEGQLCARLAQLAASDDAVIAEHARWALARRVVPPAGED